MGGILQDLYGVVRGAWRGYIRGAASPAGRIAAGSAGCGASDRIQPGGGQPGDSGKMGVFLPYYESAASLYGEMGGRDYAELYY